MTVRLVRAAVVGESAPGLEHLIQDVMTDVGVPLELVTAVSDAEIIFAVVNSQNVVSIVCAASVTGRPVIALLPMSDERIARRALACGARACHSLETPLEHLTVMLIALFRSGAEATNGASRPMFSLGRNSRKVLAELRHSASRQPALGFAVSRDAEARLESAVRADVGRCPIKPFRFGMCARLEIALMRLDEAAISCLERAIDSDL